MNVIRLKFVVTTILFSLSHLTLFAQEDVIIWNKGAKIKWSDFKGRVDRKSPFSTMSAFGIYYKYNLFSTGKVNKVRFTIDVRFDRTKSWSKNGTRNAATLQHEQLHFDIAELVGRSFKNEVDHTAYTKDYKNEIIKIFNRYSAELQKLQSKYDLQTEHSNNKAKQQEWERLIHRELMN